MTKKFSIFLTALFCVFLGSVCLVSLLLPKQEKSQLENRYLAKPPVLSVSTLLDGSFMSGAEDYVSDHIAGRDFWVALKAWGERLSGKQENNGVYFGKENTLLNRVDTPAQSDMDAAAGYVDALVGNVSVPVCFGLIPSSSAIWADRLPAGAPTADEKALIQSMYFSTGAETVDFYSALAAHSSEDIYYRTDHHWTSLGAYYGANALLETMGLAPLDLNHLQKTTVSDQFYGTTFSTSGVRWVPPDQIDTYVPDDGLDITSYFGAAPTKGSLYVPSHLQEKDKYSYFLGGNQSLCIIRTQSQGPKLLLIRDSYSDSLAPFLTQRFSEIHLFDPRYNLTSVKDYVEQNHIDNVAVLFSFANFTKEKNLFVLGK